MQALQCQDGLIDYEINAGKGQNRIQRKLSEQNNILSSVEAELNRVKNRSKQLLTARGGFHLQKTRSREELHRQIAFDKKKGIEFLRKSRA